MILAEAAGSKLEVSLSVNSEVQDSQGHIARLPLLKKENEKRKVLIANAQESKGQ